MRFVALALVPVLLLSLWLGTPVAAPEAGTKPAADSTTAKGEAAGKRTGGWRAPEEARKVPNPVKPTAESVASGQALFEKSCLKCHGPQGHGDGKMAKILTAKPADLTSRLQFQSDGEIFWKIGEGKNPMPSFKKDLKPEERWNVVNYVRQVIVGAGKAAGDSARAKGTTTVPGETGGAGGGR